jgi:hypothetical protein
MPRPRREEFILDVRRSARTLRNSNVETNSHVMDTDAISRLPRQAGQWLTLKVVARYDPEDFAAGDAEWQERLPSSNGRSIAIAGEPACLDRRSG